VTDPVVGERPEPWSVPVVLHEPDPAWPALAEGELSGIRDALGPVALAADHVGSTSVPGLPAKPVLDLLLQVSDSADETAYVPRLSALGYWLQVREPDWLEHRVLYRRTAGGSPSDVNLHVLSPRLGSGEIARMLTFRDWLRSHPRDRDRYAAVKRELAARPWRYVQDYADAKSEVVEEILGRAAQERR
jgi:GrpB-like predicted nucleotidyltransferase (UPF0157 family)